MPKLNTYTLNTAVNAAFQMLGIIPGAGSTFQTVRVSPAALIAFIQEHSAAVDGREVEMQKSATHVQWRYVGDATWIDLIPLADITGSSGANGADGDEVEMRTNSTHVQWKLLSASVWNNLIPLADLKGEAGTGLTNRGVWAAGTFNPGDYAFATGSIGSGNAMWVLSDSAPYASSVQPKDDPTHWIEQAAPAGPAGDDGLSVELQKSATHIQWRQTGGTWADLVPLANLVGAAGSAGAAGAKWHTGTDVPAAGTGVDGDFYLRSNGDYYGPKVAGAWGAIVASLKGASGSAIPAGGTTGQVLTKASAGDGDAIWQTPAAGGGGASNISGNFTVPNNGVISWDIAANAAGWGMIYLDALGATPVTQFAFNTAGSTAIFTTLAGSGNVLTGVLTGTTGQAGKITISVAAGKVYLENRMGWGVGITVFLSIPGTLV